MASEQERLASLETSVEVVKKDVSEIKGDVKRLLLSDAQKSGMAILVNRGIPFLALVLSIAALYVR